MNHIYDLLSCFVMPFPHKSLSFLNQAHIMKIKFSTWSISNTNFMEQSTTCTKWSFPTTNSIIKPESFNKWWIKISDLNLSLWIWWKIYIPCCSQMEGLFWSTLNEAWGNFFHIKSCISRSQTNDKPMTQWSTV